MEREIHLGNLGFRRSRYGICLHLELPKCSFGGKPDCKHRHIYYPSGSDNSWNLVTPRELQIHPSYRGSLRAALRRISSKANQTVTDFLKLSIHPGAQK